MAERDATIVNTGYPRGFGLRYGYPPPLAVTGGAVLFAVSGQLTSTEQVSLRDTLTGQARWTAAAHASTPKRPAIGDSRPSPARKMD
jgi:hypothetical protein